MTQEQQPTAETRKPWSRGRKVAVAIGAVVLALIVVAVLRPPAAPQATGTPPAVAGSVAPAPAETPTLPAATQPPAPSGTPSSATPTPTVSQPAATPAFEDIELSGTGSKVERLSLVAPAIAVIRHDGTRNFAVSAVSADGTSENLLVNTIGNYAGVRRLELLFTDELPAALTIDADGGWTIVVRDLSLADAWDGQTALTGTGDNVFRVDPPVSGLLVVTVAHEGERNFAISAEGGLIPDLVVNEIGNVSEETTLRVGTNLLDITADGDWSITPE